MLRRKWVAKVQHLFLSELGGEEKKKKRHIQLYYHFPISGQTPVVFITQRFCD